MMNSNFQKKMLTDIELSQSNKRKVVRPKIQKFKIVFVNRQ